MTIISLFYFGGIVPSSSQKHYSPRIEAPWPYNPRLTATNHEFHSEVLEDLRDNFDRQERTPEFWKNRIITHFALSPLHSVTFIPFDVTYSQVWYVGKHDIESQSFAGFSAPFLSKDYQAALGCVDLRDQLSTINNQSDLVKSISSIRDDAKLDTAFLLKYFFQDQLTQKIGFTYVSQGGQLQYRYWSKGPRLNYELHLEKCINKLISGLQNS